MTELEQYDFYKTLNNNFVSVKDEKHKMFHAQHYYTDTVYSFGIYKVIETLHAQESKLPGLYFITIFKGNRPLGGWCQKQSQESKHIYDKYLTVKNKAEKIKNSERHYQ